MWRAEGRDWEGGSRVGWRDGEIQNKTDTEEEEEGNDVNHSGSRTQK